MFLRPTCMESFSVLWLFSRLKIRRTLHDLIHELIHQVQTDYKLHSNVTRTCNQAAFNSKELKLDVLNHSKTKCTQTCISNPCCLIQGTSTWHAFEAQQRVCQSNNVTILGFSSVYTF